MQVVAPVVPTGGTIGGDSVRHSKLPSRYRFTHGAPRRGGGRVAQAHGDQTLRFCRIYIAQAVLDALLGRPQLRGDFFVFVSLRE
jgi:hypothetical protein